MLAISLDCITHLDLGSPVEPKESREKIPRRLSRVLSSNPSGPGTDVLTYLTHPHLSSCSHQNFAVWVVEVAVVVIMIYAAFKKLQSSLRDHDLLT